MSDRPCPVCKGARLKPAALAVTVGGYNVVDVCQLPINQALQFFLELEGSEQEALAQSKWSAGEANGKNGHHVSAANGAEAVSVETVPGKNGTNGTGFKAHPTQLSIGR